MGGEVTEDRITGLQGLPFEEVGLPGQEQGKGQQENTRGHNDEGGEEPAPSALDCVSALREFADPQEEQAEQAQAQSPEQSAREPVAGREEIAEQAGGEIDHGGAQRQADQQIHRQEEQTAR